MDNVFKYRFKTEKEFIKEFGPNWRTVVKLGFIQQMDMYLGQKIYPKYNYKINKMMINHLDVILNYNHAQYNISLDMITEIKMVPNYNKKIFVY